MITMLKFIGTLRNGPSRLGSRSSVWGIANQQISACSSTATASQAQVEKTPVTKSSTSTKYPDKSKYPMVNLVFDALKNDSDTDTSRPIADLKSVDQLLSIANNKQITHEIAVTTVTALCQMVERGKLSFRDFEPDPRYQKLCRLLARRSAADVRSRERRSSASVIIGMDDYSDTYREIQKLSVHQTVKTMSTLALKQKRVKPLLRSLAGNIYRSTAPLSIKEIADVLYSMACLNFPDEPLLERLCNDLVKSIDSVGQSPIIGSIVTSLGMLRYRNSQVMDVLSQWIVKHKDVLRTQDLCSLLMTLATIGYHPTNSEVLFKELVPTLKETEMIKSSEWLDVVWALTILNQVSFEQLQSVLNDNFISKLADPEEIPVVKKTKLLNINAAAGLLMKDYPGPLLSSDSSVLAVSLVKTKEKQTFVKAITDALANLFPSRDHFQINVDTGTGFLLDVEFFMDKKCAPLPIAKITDDNKALRIAIVANYYHDYCIGEKNLLGSVLLHYRLLEAKGYRILDISHSEFHTDDKLLKRITYINNRIKAIVK